MNTKQLRKNVGETVFIRPKAWLRDSNTGSLRQVEHLWRIEDVKKKHVRLFNIDSGHVRDIPNDSVKEYRDTKHLHLTVQLTMDGSQLTMEPLFGPPGATTMATPEKIVYRDRPVAVPVFYPVTAPVEPAEDPNVLGKLLLIGLVAIWAWEN